MFAKNYVCALEQLLAGFGQDNFSRRAYKKLGARFIFQLPDLHANRSLCHVNARGARGKRPAFSDGHKSFHLADVHNPTLHQHALLRE